MSKRGFASVIHESIVIPNEKIFDFSKFIFVVNYCWDLVLIFIGGSAFPLGIGTIATKVIDKYPNYCFHCEFFYKIENVYFDIKYASSPISLFLLD